MRISPPSRQTPGRPARAGFTLIELLVVVSIIMILAGVLISQIRPAMASRKIREAARMTSTLFSHARARAASTGRPCGVLIQRTKSGGDDNLGVRDLFLAEVPPIYAGDTDRASALLGPAESRYVGNATLTDANPKLVKKGDLIRFNYQGALYQILTSGGAQITFSSQYAPLPRVDPQNPTSLPFQIFRRPRKLVTGAIQLKGGAVIDLANSGTGDNAEFGSAQESIYIMFSPNGSLDRIYQGDGNNDSPLSGNALGNFPRGPVFLLIGRIDKTGSENLAEPINLWVSIGHQSGMVSVAGMGSIGGGLRQSRFQARQQQSKGGN